MSKKDKYYNEIRSNLRKENLATDFFNIMLLARVNKSTDEQEYMKHYLSFQKHVYDSCYAFAKYYISKRTRYFPNAEVVKDIRSAIFLLIIENFNEIINSHNPNSKMFDLVNDNISEIISENAWCLQAPIGDKMQKKRSGRIRLDNYATGLTVNYKFKRAGRFVSFEEPVAGPNGDATPLIDLVEQEKVDIIHKEMSEEHKKMIRETLFKGRKPQAVKILKCIFNLNPMEYHYTFAGVAKKYKCSRQYVYKIYKQAVNNIKSNPELKKILKNKMTGKNNQRRNNA